MRELHSSLKPERDSRVANRLIGAALGVRVPPKPQASKKTTPAAKVESAPEIPDAWDD